MARISLILVLVIGCCGVGARAQVQAEKAFPGEEEITLVVTQSERAVQRFKPLLDDQEAQLGKSVTDHIAEGRRAAATLDATLNILKARPQGFNGGAGFALFQALGAADRNVLQCESAASSQSAGYMMAAQPDKSDTLLRLSQSCSDLSTLLFTITEQVGSLFRQYVDAEDHYALQITHEARQCEESMDKKKNPKFAPAY